MIGACPGGDYHYYCWCCRLGRLRLCHRADDAAAAGRDRVAGAVALAGADDGRLDDGDDGAGDVRGCGWGRGGGVLGDGADCGGDGDGFGHEDYRGRVAAVAAAGVGWAGGDCFGGGCVDCGGGEAVGWGGGGAVGDGVGGGGV